MKRLILAAITAATLAGCAWVPPPFTIHAGPGHYCFGEGGHIDECVFPGSRDGFLRIQSRVHPNPPVYSVKGER